jgi:hypothetical protein
MNYIHISECCCSLGDFISFAVHRSIVVWRDKTTAIYEIELWMVKKDHN